jgi:hypothetical protein
MPTGDFPPQHYWPPMQYWYTPMPTTFPHKCPACDGIGLVSKPPGVAGDQQEWTSTSTGPYPCKACGGGGVLWG